jgi:hypothetical protein
MIITRAAKETLFQNSIQDFFSSYFGDLPKILYEQCLPAITESYEFGKKILGLLIGWFLVLFVVERVLMVLLWLIRFTLRIIFSSTSPRKTTASKELKQIDDKNK